MFGLLVMGRSAYEDIATYRKDELFRSAFGLEYVPARETLRIYLGRMARKIHGIIAMLFGCNTAVLKRAAITPIDIEGYMLDCELRPGTQHSQKGTPEFLARNFQMIREL
ncbi:MAG: hypothetical protein ACOYM2_01735 [Rectinemataceae bacterium]